MEVKKELGAVANPDHADLIARLEAATGPDRVLDCYIHAEIIRRDPSAKVRVVGPPTYDEPRYFFHPDNGDDWIGYDLLGVSPTYTASIDAALTLVPEGYYGRVWFGEPPPHIAYHESTAAIWAVDTKVQHSVFGCSSKQTLPAIALCIAALKARAAPPRSSMGGAK